jgi:nucleoside-diphosphate-sugar epimerase
MKNMSPNSLARNGTSSPALPDVVKPRQGILAADDRILVTGAGGFIGSRVVERLLDLGFRNVRCLVRPSGRRGSLDKVRRRPGLDEAVEVVQGNLLSPDDCLNATRDVAVIYHLAAGRGQKSFADAFLNSVVTTRNLLEACRQHGCVRRLVSVSSFSVYASPARCTLDEQCPMESRPHLRGDAYTFAKVKQDEIVMELGGKYGIPFVLVRPGVVYGPGNEGIHGRVGIGTFGLFLHLGGSNPLPLTYVENCADAIVLAGLNRNIDGEVFNIVDDQVPSSRQFLRLYKRHVRHFRSIYVPHAASYFLCYLWEKYSAWSQGQLPPAFNRLMWRTYWRRTGYSNAKAKRRLGWVPQVPTAEALRRHFESCRLKGQHA